MYCSLSRASPATPLVAFSAPGLPAASYVARNPVLFLTFWDVFKRPLDRFFRRANCPCRPIEAQKADEGESKKNVNGLIEKILYGASRERRLCPCPSLARALDRRLKSKRRL